MQGVLELAPCVPFPVLPALRGFRFPQHAAVCSPSRPSEVYTPVRGAHTRCSELTYRFSDITLCTLLVRSCRWSGYAPFYGRPAPCSVANYEPVTLDLLQGAQLMENIGECPLLPTV